MREGGACPPNGDNIADITDEQTQDDRDDSAERDQMVAPMRSHFAKPSMSASPASRASQP